MQRFSISPQELFASVWRHRNLVISMTKREIIGRYRGSFMGILWSFFNPVFMLAIYTFVFGFVFKSRWNQASDSQAEFAVVLFAGLIVFNLFSEVVNRAPQLILSNPNYVKKVVFPLEILSWVAMGSALFHAVISLLVWLIAYVLAIGWPQPTALLLPLAILPLILLTLGVAWFLASLGVYFRDVAQFIGLATTALMFMSPIFFPVTAIPEPYRQLLYMNPLTPTVEGVRDVLYWGRGIQIGAWAMSMAVGLVVAWLGFAWFQKTRSGFADVL